MNASATGTLTKSGGCGCGCSGGASPAKPCSCKKAGCEECETHGVVRPQFFAGQLLTEDDLQSLTTYVVAKQRLHTRHLHGAGVVCGLEVTCPPCEGGTVVVEPGYALDCCGNDIVVPCPTELDILSMIRQLRIDSRGGHDCGDPCADSKAARRRDPAAPTTPPPSISAIDRLRGEDGARPRTPAEDGAKPFRERYCLYVRYCETPADPVKPFVIDEPCGDGSACEFTRVREGYRFELRCEADHKPQPTMADRIALCSNLDELKETVRSAEASAPRAMRDERATALVELGEPYTLSPDDRNRLLKNAEALRAFSKEGASPDDQVTEPVYRAAFDSFNDLARTAARAEAVAGDVPDNVKEAAREARAAMQEVEPLLRQRLDVFTRSEDRLFARAVLDDASRFVINDPSPELKTSAEASYFIYGGTQSPELAAFDYQQLVQLRQWLKRRIGGGVASDCRLRGDLEAIQIDPQDVNRKTSLELLRRRLLEILKRYITACTCAAFLPPCAPCDDTAVLLACLTVEECEVIDVCNLERTFVLSWPAMRYWMPWFSQIGEMVEQLCCGPRKVEAPYDGATTTKPYGAYMIHDREARVLTESAKLMADADALSPLETAFRLATPRGDAAIERVAHLLGRTVLPAEGELPVAAEAAIVPQGEPLAEALRGPEPKRLINDLIDRRVNELRPQADLENVVDVVEMRLKSVDTKIADLRREVKKRPVPTAETKAAKKAVATADDTSRRLEKINEDLMAHVESLTRRIEQLEGK